MICDLIDNNGEIYGSVDLDTFDETVLPPDDCPDKRKFLIHQLPVDILIKRPSRNFIQEHTHNKTAIFRFSESSARRLNVVARNSGRFIKSQVCLTFHNTWPVDGVQVKAIFHNFLVKISKLFPVDLYYLWCLEFQERNAPHFHFYSSIPPTWENQALIIDAWVSSAKLSNDPTSVWWHMRDENFFAWKMSAGSYLVKEYIAKSSQKQVPEQYKNVGRFWGHSRNMKPQITVIDPEQIDGTSPPLLVAAVRAIRKMCEKRIDNHKKLSAKKEKEFNNLIASGRSKKESSRIVRTIRLQEVCSKERVAKKTALSRKIKSYSLPLCTAAFLSFLTFSDSPVGNFSTLNQQVKIIQTAAHLQNEYLKPDFSFLNLSIKTALNSEPF